MQKLFPLILVAILIAACQPMPPHQPESPLYKVYIPAVNVPLPTPTVQPTATPTPCYRTPQAATFAHLLTIDKRQQRSSLTCHPALVEAAQQRAESLARGGYWSHCDPGGVCPNEVVRKAGCALSLVYMNHGNNVESLVAGTPDVGVAFDVLSRSPAHAVHLFGENDFFRQQRHVGVAYVDWPGARWRHYWVIMIATCG